MPVKPFILNDETVVNSYGFVIKNSGGKFDRFRDNPVMLDSHNTDSVNSVIGKWNNLRIEGSRLLADPQFDVEDPDAKKIEGKVERGFVKGASMGIHIEDAEMQDIPGFGFIPVVTSWELLESSPVGVPSNKASLRFYASNGTLLKASEIKLSIDTIINLKQPAMEKITLSVEAAKALGISKDPEISDLNAAIMELSAQNVQLKKDKDTAETTLNDHKRLQAKELVDLAVNEGRLSADKRESFEKLAVSDYKQAKDLLDAMPKKQTFSGKIVTPEFSAPAGREDWDYMKWLKEDPKGLSAMEQNDPEGFAALKAKYKKS